MWTTKKAVSSFAALPYPDQPMAVNLSMLLFSSLIPRMRTGVHGDHDIIKIGPEFLQQKDSLFNHLCIQYSMYRDIRPPTASM